MHPLPISSLSSFNREQKHALLIYSKKDCFLFLGGYLGWFVLQQLELSDEKKEKTMHHPPKKAPKTIRNELSSGTALLIGRELPDLPKFREARLRENKHAHSLISKDRFLKYDDFQFELNELKIDGKQIASSLNIDNLKIKRKNIQTDKIGFETPLQGTVMLKTKPKNHKLTIPARKQKESPHKTFQQEVDKQKQNSYEDNVLPDISPVMDSHPKSEKKVAEYRTAQRKSDREGFSITKTMKRRDTMVDTGIKNGGNEDSGKNKQEFKKIINIMQYREFLLTINLTNRLLILPEEDVQYKAYICKGNNGLLVKSILKTRPWWSFRTSGEIDSCHLVWTQWKRNKTMNQLALITHQEYVETQSSPFNFIIKTKNEEIQLKMKKKFNNFSKVIGNHTNICKKYDNSMLSQNYLTFAGKINSKAFEDSLQKVMKNEEYSLFEPGKEKKMMSHVPGCLYLHSKKLLFQSISKYYQKLEKDVFSVIPVTFLISKGLNDPQFQRFCLAFQQFSNKNKGDKRGNIWICKPGENSNRGHGIQVVSSLAQIRALVGQKCNNNRTLIIQKYMENPFLYNKRKFDIRCYVLITCVNGCIKGYWYEESYVRTTSKEYTLKNLDNKLIHLTNDAIQKKGEEYGKFQNNNKVSIGELERYIENSTEVKFATIYDKMKTISAQLIQSVAKKLNVQHKEFSFEVFGLDYMLDDKLNPFLIEANSNPCLEVDGNVLGKVIPRMVENVIRVAIDPVFPPPYSESTRNRFSPGSTFESNQMVLVYDSLHDPSWQNKEEVEEALANDREADEFEGEEDQL